MSGISFFNIKSGEMRVCEGEPMIAAFWASSNLGPNANKGQDFGWRLSPETITELESIKQDPTKIAGVAAFLGVQRDLVMDSEILFYIANQQEKAKVVVERTTEPKFEEVYNQKVAEIKKAKKAGKKK